MPDFYDVIDVRREDCIDYVTLNRPGVRNAIVDLRTSTEVKEGICAFLDKRPPRWVEDDCL